MKVLVVEDEPALARQLAEALGAAGYAVDRAVEGERADVLARRERYDAVVLDLGLPRIDGSPCCVAGATTDCRCPSSS